MESLEQLELDIRTIIDYNWADELEDFRNEENQNETHIFVRLVRVNNFLHGLTEDPKQLVAVPKVKRLQLTLTGDEYDAILAALRTVALRGLDATVEASFYTEQEAATPGEKFFDDLGDRIGDAQEVD